MGEVLESGREVGESKAGKGGKVDLDFDCALTGGAGGRGDLQKG